MHISTIKVIVIPIFCLLLSIPAASAQKKINPQDTVPISLTEKRFMEKYNRNIKKSRINGVYIPKDLNEAFMEIQQLAKKESLDKFKKADANLVVGRLHYGLGRWIILNWNFYDGSRISHHLKSYGVTHPDDQARFFLFALHNHLNGKDLDLKNISDKVLAERQAIRDARKG